MARALGRQAISEAQAQLELLEMLHEEATEQQCDLDTLRYICRDDKKCHVLFQSLPIF